MVSDFEGLYEYRDEPPSDDPEAMRKALHVRMRERFFTSLIRREGLSKADIAEELAQLDIVRRAEPYAIVSVKIVSWEKSFYSDNTDIPERVKRFVRFIILNVTEELLGAVYPVNSIVIDGSYACVINVVGKKDEYFTHLSDASGVLEKTLAENCGIVAQIDASSVVADIESLSSAYEQIQDIEKYRRLMQNDDLLLTYGDISKEKPTVDYFKSEQALISLARAGDYERVKDELTALAFKIYAGGPDYHSAQFLFTRLQSSVRAVVSAASRQTGSVEFWQELDTPRLISGAQSFAELSEVIDYIFERVGGYDNEVAETPKWFPQLLSMVETGYFDPNINVNTLANALGITATHLSRTFRRFRGIGLPDYIHIKRIEAAKKYIADGYSIKKVTELVGYANQLTMSRAFKKFEGYTPGQYPLTK